jgi:hypothetical protein
VLARFAHSRARCAETFDQVSHSTPWSIFARATSYPTAIECLSASCPFPLDAGRASAPTMRHKVSRGPVSLRQQRVAPSGECAALVTFW